MILKRQHLVSLLCRWHPWRLSVQATNRWQSRFRKCDLWDVWAPNRCRRLYWPRLLGLSTLRRFRLVADRGGRLYKPCCEDCSVLLVFLIRASQKVRKNIGTVCCKSNTLSGCPSQLNALARVEPQSEFSSELAHWYKRYECGVRWLVLRRKKAFYVRRSGPSLSIKFYIIQVRFLILELSLIDSLLHRSACVVLGEKF